MKIEYNTDMSAELLIQVKDEDIVRYSFEKRRVQDKEPVYNKLRVNSVAEQSTRYCNYSKEKFEGEVTYIKPSWSDLPISKYKPASYPKEYNNCTAADKLLLDSLVCAEHFYYQLISRGWKPQQARETLPLATATEVVYTAFEEDWKHFFDLRHRGTTGAPHPNAKQVAIIAHDLIKKKLGKDL